MSSSSVPAKNNFFFSTQNAAYHAAYLPLTNRLPPAYHTAYHAAYRSLLQRPTSPLFFDLCLM